MTLISERGGPEVAARRPPQELVDSCGSSAAPPELVDSDLGELGGSDSLELGGSAELGGPACGSSAAPLAGARRLRLQELGGPFAGARRLLCFGARRPRQEFGGPYHCCIAILGVARRRARELSSSQTNEEGSVVG